MDQLFPGYFYLPCTNTDSQTVVMGMSGVMNTWILNNNYLALLCRSGRGRDQHLNVLCFFSGITGAVATGVCSCFLFFFFFLFAISKKKYNALALNIEIDIGCGDSRVSPSEFLVFFMNSPWTD